MRAIVFGGSGFIGTHLARDLVAAGGDVVVADIMKGHVAVPGTDFEYCDVREPITIPHHEPFDVVYNLAAVHRTPGHQPAEYYETNVSGAQNIMDWCADGGEMSVVFTSSIAVYGPSEDPKYETTPPRPNSDYGRSKLIAESIHRRWRTSGPGRRLAIVRPAVVFGPGEHGNFTRLASALRRGRFAYAGRTNTIKSCGYVSDLVRAMRYIESLDDCEVIFNYCYPQRYTIAQICEAFHQVAGFALPRTIPPALMTSVMRALKLVNPSEKGNLSAARVKKLTASTNIVPEVLMSRGFEWETDIRSALEAWQSESGDRFE